MSKTTVAVAHARVETAKGFAEVRAGLQRQLVHFDLNTLSSLLAIPQEAGRHMEAVAGTNGFMLFGVVDHGLLLAILGETRKAVQYVLGNPLFTVEMTRYNVASGLYAPLRLLVYENEEGQTFLEYEARRRICLSLASRVGTIR